MIIDYTLIRNSVKSIVESRKNMPIDAISDISGFLCEQIAKGVASYDQAIEYLDAVLINDFGALKVDGKYHKLSEHLSDTINNSPLCIPMEKKLIGYRGGDAQIGPGEFIFCWYDPKSVFQQSNVELGDITKDGKTLEFKKINGNNYTRAELFDFYASKGVDVLLGVYTISKKSAKPQFNTQYCAVEAANWRSAFTHKLNKDRTGSEKDAYSLECLAEKVG